MAFEVGGRTFYDAGLAALTAGQWAEAAESLEQAAEVDPTAAVLEALGRAYFWTDRPETIEVRERAYKAHRAARDPYGSARVATALAFDHLTFRGEESTAQGWLQLAGRALEGHPVAAEHGHLLLWEADFAISAADLREWTRAVRASVEPWATGDVYLNFISHEGPDRLRAGFGAGWDRLVAVKREFDPDNVFRLNHNIRPSAG
ncbi:BBE domain-containing protein [Nocardioides insulae]|uniref:BBE domain-containing protein n=1 Tax=Nocardioides insulae TaxID=394734 RepID=UPI00048A7BC7|nr:BBE domain-containing protein [Nocardioides insulae]